MPDRHVARLTGCRYGLEHFPALLEAHDRAQSSSANLVTAGASVFFVLIQSRERPD
jgi:hypothetical protein